MNRKTTAVLSISTHIARESASQPSVDSRSLPSAAPSLHPPALPTRHPAEVAAARSQSTSALTPPSTLGRVRSPLCGGPLPRRSLSHVSRTLAGRTGSLARGRCVVIKTSTRQTIFLPVVGLVDAEQMKPADLVRSHSRPLLAVCWDAVTSADNIRRCSAYHAACGGAAWQSTGQCCRCAVQPMHCAVSEAAR